MTLCVINRYLPLTVVDPASRRTPFSYGILHIKEAVSSKRTDEQSPSPKERVLHLITGVFLLIPLVNQLIFFILRSYTEVRNSPFRFKSISLPFPSVSNDDSCNSDPEAIQWAMKAGIVFQQRESSLQQSEISNQEPESFDEWLQRGKSKGYLNERFECFYRQTVLERFVCNSTYGLKIIEQGADLRSINNPFSNTVLHTCIANALNTKALQIIQCNEATPILNFQCSRGNTLLHLAIGKGYTTISADRQQLDVPNFQLTQALLERGANPNLQNRNGNTPLHLACLRRDIPTIQALLNHGADRTLVNYNGKRAEDLLWMSYYDAVAILKDTVVIFLLDKKQWAANHSGALAALL